MLTKEGMDGSPAGKEKHNNSLQYLRRTREHSIPKKSKCFISNVRCQKAKKGKLQLFRKDLADKVKALETATCF